MTLHEAIEKLLLQTGRPMTTHEITNELNKNYWYQKKDGSQITPLQIHGRTKNYPELFNRNGTTVSFAGEEPIKLLKQKAIITEKPKPFKTSTKDEHYVLDLCDLVLNHTSLRQHRFDFLIGDINANGSSAKLPVDGYYEKLNLVIEYRERQHTETVNFFDKPNRMTVSGVHRGEQRKIYDERRRILIPQNGFKLVEISYSDFNHDGQKRIIRNQNKDSEILKNILQVYVDII